MHRGKPVTGVFQRCTDECPATECRLHLWHYEAEGAADHNGKRRRLRQGGFTTGKEAMLARAEAVSRERAGLLPADLKLTVGQWLAKWLQMQSDIHGTGIGTLRGYVHDINSYWIPSIGHLKLTELRTWHITQTLLKIKEERDAERQRIQEINDKAVAEAAERDKERVARGLKRPIRAKLLAVPREFGPKTARNAHAVLRNALNAAVRAGEISTNAAIGAELPKYRKKKVKPWSPELLGQWLDSIIDMRLYPLYHIGAFNGMRRGELCGLRWDDIDFDKGRVTLRTQITNVSYCMARAAIREGRQPEFLLLLKTDSGQDRFVDLDPGSLELLLIVRAQQEQEAKEWGDQYQNHDGLVFTREDGSPNDPTQVYKLFVKSVRKLGLEHVPLHTLRHIAASLLIEAGVDIALISKRLGHSKISITADTYGHLIGKASKRAAAAAAKLVPRGMGKSAVKGKPETKKGAKKKGKKKARKMKAGE